MVTWPENSRQECPLDLMYYNHGYVFNNYVYSIGKFNEGGRKRDDP